MPAYLEKRTNKTSDVFGASIQGTRSEQQDAFRIRWVEDEQAWLLIVADGMGGHAAGALAGRIAVDSFVAKFVAERRKRGSVRASLIASLHDVNERIREAQRADPAVAGMGTTLLAVYIADEELYWISVGDSPLFLRHQDQTIRLNEDHSLRGEPASLNGNILRSAVVGETIPLVDCPNHPTSLSDGDVVLMASDGVLTLGEQELGRLMTETPTASSESIVTTLLASIEQRAPSSQDNCTILAARFQTPASKPDVPAASNENSKGIFGFRPVAWTLFGAIVVLFAAWLMLIST